MRRIPLLAALALIASCGPSFAGHWTGPVTKDRSCDDGTNPTSGSFINTWIITEGVQPATELAISLRPECDPVAATVSGRIATMTQKTCSLVVSSTAQETSNVVSGTLTLSGNSMTVDVTIGTTIQPFTGGTILCTEHSTAPLLRE